MRKSKQNYAKKIAIVTYMTPDAVNMGSSGQPCRTHAVVWTNELRITREEM